MSRKIILAYYAATILFVSLDYGFGVNVRVSFLEAAPNIRLIYYAVCFGCLALMIWRPAWTTVVGTVESLATLIALIINMGMRATLVSDTMLRTGTGFITIEEIFNFLIAGAAAYVSYMQGLRSLTNRSGFG
ncbi:MAG: hypothetical protein GWN47_01725 [Woeseiaceae bacterium]|nr:hypothetical protein [Woeseiaceae bacterium]